MVGNYYYILRSAGGGSTISNTLRPISRPKRRTVCSTRNATVSSSRTSWKRFLGGASTRDTRSAGQESKFYNLASVTAPWNVRYSNGSRSQYDRSVPFSVRTRIGSAVKMVALFSFDLLMAPRLTRE